MRKTNFRKLQELLPGFKKNILLKNYTTFRIGGPAQYFFIAKTKKDLIKAISTAKKFKIPFFIIGGGSNTLVSDKGFKGMVIKIQFKNFKIKNSKIFTEAGAFLSFLLGKSAEEGLTGLEWAAGIPGTIGGAIRGNAGAFGGEIKDVVKEVEALDIQKLRIKKIKKRDCQFGYRESRFKKEKNLIILSATLKLEKGNQRRINERIKEILAYRKKKHPQRPSAGSIFQNVEVKKLKKNFFKKFPKTKKIIKENILPAAFLINQCRLVGKKIGKTQISEKHPNFIINLNNGQAKDVKRLINLVKKKVKNKFGIILEEEIQYLGF